MPEFTGTRDLTGYLQILWRWKWLFLFFVVAAPVGAYMAVISLMVASAIGTREALAIGGAGLFFSSDAMIAWERFVSPRSWHRLAIIVTYHLAQTGLTLSLLT